jgi:aspartyl-tRNA(Asn)/glutamyl-tRNA(Gln) amidotransferase subunit B
MKSNVEGQKLNVEKYLVKGYLPTIGIECHVQLKTKTKLFAAVSNDARNAEPNTLVSHICFGLPGALPVLNEEAVRLAARAAYALGTKPQPFSKFDRKHYFYPDLPKGYQISQFDQPIILGGSIPISLDSGEQKDIAITRAHMEEDAGKSTHPVGADYSLVDLNRAGTPLLEIVSEPEIHSAAEAKAFAKELWLRLKFADVSDVDLYHGNMRFDVNVSVSKNPDELGIRSETKNLNSFKAVERAVDYEIKRQIELLNSGEQVVQETRGWLDDKQKTVSQRTKEDAHDYRYFPDPDIPPIVLDDVYIAAIEKDFPVLPDEWRKKLVEVGIEKTTIEGLLEAEAEISVDFLSLMTEAKPEQARNFANWITNIEVPLLRAEPDLQRSDNAVRMRIYNEVMTLVADGKLSSTNAKALIEDLLRMKMLPKNIEEFADSQNYIQVSDSSEIEKIVARVIENNPKPADDVRNGELKAIGFLVGQVMKESGGKANPALAQATIKQQLGI